MVRTIVVAIVVAIIVPSPFAVSSHASAPSTARRGGVILPRNDDRRGGNGGRREMQDVATTTTYRPSSSHAPTSAPPFTAPPVAPTDAPPPPTTPPPSSMETTDTEIPTASSSSVVVVATDDPTPNPNPIATPSPASSTTSSTPPPAAIDATTPSPTTPAPTYSSPTSSSPSVDVIADVASTDVPTASSSAVDAYDYDDGAAGPIEPTERPTRRPTAGDDDGGDGEADDATSTARPTSSSSSGGSVERKTHAALGLSMTLHGVSDIVDVYEWEVTTSTHFGGVYNEDGEREEGTYDYYVYSVNVKANYVDRRGGFRELQYGGGGGRNGDASITITYDQEATYASIDRDWKPDENFAFIPLNTVGRRDEYVGSLKGLDGYEDLTYVSGISLSSDDDASGRGVGDDDDEGGDVFWTTGAIIGIAVGGSVAFFGIVVAIVVRYNRGRYDDKDNNGVDQPVPTEILRYQSPADRTCQETSTAWDSQLIGGGGRGRSSSPSPSTNEYSYNENRTVGTMDYDYAAAYGGMGGGGGGGGGEGNADDAAWSLSDAGGTVGSRITRLTTGVDDATPHDANMANPMPISSSGGNTVFSEDPTFDMVYDDVREILMDVYAPAGKLGVVIDTPNDGAPTIHAVKDTSPIVDKVRVGDMLVAVDDEDVRAMTAMRVSKLISKKGNNPSRKLTIVRHER